MKTTLIYKIAFICTCFGIYSYTATSHNNGSNYNFSIDTSKPLSIEWPVEIAIVGDEGEKGFRIGANIGRGWRDEAQGQASYSFYVPSDDKYYFWAQGLWFDECSNAVFAQIDNLDKTIIGNDPIYNKWHWVRGFSINLGKGTHILTLSNHSDHISLQKLYISNSALFVPDSLEPVFSDIFYDGFDGCDQGNFTQWNNISGNWTISQSTQISSEGANMLVGNSEKEALIIYDNKDLEEYSLNVTMFIDESENINGTAAICFGVQDPNNFHELQFQYLDNQNKCHATLFRYTNGIQETLNDFDLSWNISKCREVEITLNANNIEIQVDDNYPVITDIDYKISGGIGLHLEGSIKTYFDDIHIRQIIQ